MKNNMMDKNMKIKLLITSLVTLLPMEVGLITWKQLPDQMVSHFNFVGTPDSYMSKWMDVFVLPLFLVALHLICSLTTMGNLAIGSEKKQIPPKAMNVLLWICPMVSIFVTALIYGYTFGVSMNIPFLAQIFVGVVFIITGNIMPKLGPNNLAGVRVRWTQESRKNWDHTQRFSGWMMCITGLCFFVSAFAGLAVKMNQTAFLVLFFVLIMGFVLASVLYSYVYFVKHHEEADYFEEK